MKYKVKTVLIIAATAIVTSCTTAAAVSATSDKPKLTPLFFNDASATRCTDDSCYNHEHLVWVTGYKWQQDLRTRRHQPVLQRSSQRYVFSSIQLHVFASAGKVGYPDRKIN